MKNDGGVAFPHDGESVPFSQAENGMSLRDWFAAMALQGELASQQGGNEVYNAEELALWCYQVADAMLKEREKTA